MTVLPGSHCVSCRLTQVNCSVTNKPHPTSPHNGENSDGGRDCLLHYQPRDVTNKHGGCLRYTRIREINIRSKNK